MKECSIWMMTHKPEYFDTIQSGINPWKLQWFDGTNAKSFSTLLNRCVASSDNEIVIIVSHKARPQALHIEKTLDLLDKGYAFVGLHGFRFFAFKKQLFRTIGFLDERCNSGYEDFDLLARLIENDLAFYMTHDVECISGPSGWKDAQGFYPGYKHWRKKWHHHYTKNSSIPAVLERTLSEEKYNYHLGPSIPVQWLQHHKHSFTTIADVETFFHCEISSIASLRFQRTEPKMIFEKPYL
jgi:hypothetical protein